jgi:hypothetical protein
MDQETAEIRERLIRLEKLARSSLELEISFVALIAAAAFFYIAKDSWGLGETAQWAVAVVAALASLIYSYKRYDL